MRQVIGSMLSLVVLGVFIASVHGDRSREVKAIEDANGKTIKVAPGDLLTIQLAGNPTTGFGWFIEKNDKAKLSPVGKPEYRADPAVRGIAGGGGKYTFKFEAEKPGTTDLKLVYKRPWEKDKEPAKTFSVKIVIE